MRATRTHLCALPLSLFFLSFILPLFVYVFLTRPMIPLKSVFGKQEKRTLVNRIQNMLIIEVLLLSKLRTEKKKRCVCKCESEWEGERGDTGRESERETLWPININNSAFNYLHSHTHTFGALYNTNESEIRANQWGTHTHTHSHSPHTHKILRNITVPEKSCVMQAGILS